MYRIIHLGYLGDEVYQSSQTEYDPMELGQAESIVTELNRDAIQSSSQDRWAVVGPFKS